VRRDLRCAKAGDGPWRGGASEAERGEGVVSARSKKERKKERKNDQIQQIQPKIKKMVTHKGVLGESWIAPQEG